MHEDLSQGHTVCQWQRQSSNQGQFSFPRQPIKEGQEGLLEVNCHEEPGLELSSRDRGVRTRNDKIQEAGKCGSVCRQTAPWKLLQFPGQVLWAAFLPLRPWERRERSSSMCPGQRWCPWYSSGQGAHCASPHRLGGLTPSRVSGAAVESIQAKSEPSWNMALAWS